jgi:hypothetical protein
VRQIPKGFDPDVLLGHRLDYVTFAEYCVFVGFDPLDAYNPSDRIVVRIEHAYEHSLPGGPSVRVEVQARIAQSDLMRLCGRVVTRSDPSILRMEFDDGQILTVPASGGPYESYMVTVGDAEFTI